jgi:hypothetical protein
MRFEDLLVISTVVLSKNDIDPRRPGGNRRWFCVFPRRGGMENKMLLRILFYVGTE